MESIGIEVEGGHEVMAQVWIVRSGAILYLRRRAVGQKDLVSFRYSSVLISLCINLYIYLFLGQDSKEGVSAFNIATMKLVSATLNLALETTR